MSAKERELTAYHEAGHALVGHYLPTIDPIHKISIIPRGQAGGYTLALPLEDKHYNTRTELVGKCCLCSWGDGRLKSSPFGEISTGARSDLERATKTVRKMITEYGMSDNSGLSYFWTRTMKNRSFWDGILPGIKIIVKRLRRLLTVRSNGLWMRPMKRPR